MALLQGRIIEGSDAEVSSRRVERIREILAGKSPEDSLNGFETKINVAAQLSDPERRVVRKKLEVVLRRGSIENIQTGSTLEFKELGDKNNSFLIFDDEGSIRGRGNPSGHNPLDLFNPDGRFGRYALGEEQVVDLILDQMWLARVAQNNGAPKSNGIVGLARGFGEKLLRYIPGGK